jgi:short-subunit dehydrogenase
LLPFREELVESLAGKAVVITGASSGIGRAVALALGREKARVFLTARREELLSQVATEVQRRGGEAWTYPADLHSRDAATSMIHEAHHKLGRIDVLINNAAFGYFGSIEKLAPEVYRDIMAVNVEAPLAAMQAAVPLLRQQGSGHIINVSSVAGKRGLPLSGIYCATKFALNGLSEALRVELRGTGIHVSLVYPTYTESEFHSALRRADVQGDYAPVGRVQTSEEVAEAIVRCIRKPRIEVYPYSPSRFIVWISALMPALVDRVIVRAFRTRLQALRGQG